MSVSAAMILLAPAIICHTHVCLDLKLNIDRIECNLKKRKQHSTLTLRRTLVSSLRSTVHVYEQDRRFHIEGDENGADALIILALPMLLAPSLQAYGMYTECECGFSLSLSVGLRPLIG